MKIFAVDFGKINGGWKFTEENGVKYLERESIHNRLRFPATIEKKDLKVTRKDNVSTFEFKEDGVIGVNPKTFNPYVRVLVGEANNKPQPEDALIVGISEEYRLLKVEKTKGFIHSRMTGGRYLIGCIVTIDRTVRGKMFEAYCLKNDKDVVKLTVAHVAGKVTYTETNIKNVDGFKREDGRWKFSQILTSDTRPCTLVYVMKESDASKHGINQYMKKSKIYNKVDDVMLCTIPDDATPNQIEGVLTEIKAKGYQAITLVGNIRIPSEVWIKHHTQYLFTMDIKTGNVRAIRTR